MIKFVSLLAVLSMQLVISPLLHGQAAVPDSSQPSPTPQSSPQNLLDQIAPASPSLPSVEQLDAMFKQTPLGKAADDARLHAQWRELSNRTVNEADLVAARAHAESAVTDLEKRQRLRAYYTTYFDRLRARANSQELKDFLDARKAEQLAMLAQNRVRPDSPTTVKPAPTSPPKGKHKNRAVPEPALPQ